MEQAPRSSDTSGTRCAAPVGGFVRRRQEDIHERRLWQQGRWRLPRRSPGTPPSSSIQQREGSFTSARRHPSSVAPASLTASFGASPEIRGTQSLRPADRRAGRPPRWRQVMHRWRPAATSLIHPHPGLVLRRDRLQTSVRSRPGLAPYHSISTATTGRWLDGRGCGLLEM